jgi:plastocyanin
MLTAAASLTTVVILMAAVPQDSDVFGAAVDPVVEVKMVDLSATKFVFEPAEIEVQRGQTVRFVMTGLIPHNVEFKEVPGGTDLGDAMVGPFLLQKGDTYEITIDDRFGIGEHRYICTPHEVMGMKGIINVRPPEGR